MKEICLVNVVYFGSEGLEPRRMKAFVGDDSDEVAGEAEKFFTEMIKKYDSYVTEEDIEVSLEEGYHTINGCEVGDGPAYHITISWPERAEI